MDDSLGKNLIIFLKSVENNNNLDFAAIAKKITMKDTFFLNVLRKNETNKIYNVRAIVFNYYRTIGTLSQDTIFRRKINNELLRCCNDTINLNPVTNLNNFSICNNVFSNYDKYFTKNDFNDSFQNNLIEIVKTKKREIEYNLVLFIGWLELKKTIPYLKNLLKNGKNKENYEFAIYLALARMGEKEFINSSIEKIKEKYKYNNRLLMNDDEKYLIYLKQPEILSIYTNALESKESFTVYDPTLIEKKKNEDIACLALWNLTNKITTLKEFIFENYYDKKSYDEQKKEIIELKFYDKYPKLKEPIKYIDCSAKTYNAAKEWLIKNRSKYEIKFDRNKYY